MATKKTEQKPEHKHRTLHSPETIKQVGEYVRAGVKLQREISDLTGVPTKTIREWTKRYEWKVDLAEQIKEATRQKLIQRGYTDDATAIEEASNEQVTIISQHKAAIAMARRKIMDGLNALPDIEKEKDPDVKAKLAMVYLGAGNQASAALKNLIPMERQAYAIDDKGNNDLSYDELMLLKNQNDA